MHRFLPALVLLAACAMDFQSRTVVNKLRLLAVKAEPPEIGEGLPDVPDTTVVSSFVADGNETPWPRTFVFHFACTPDLDDTGDTTPPADCTTYASLASASAFLQAGAGTGRDCSAVAPGCVNPIGAEVCTEAEGCAPVPGQAPSYTLPAGICPASPLPGSDCATDPYLEVVIVTIALATEATDPIAALAELPAVVEQDEDLERHVLAVKRVSVRRPGATDELNVNPRVEGILAEGFPLEAGALRVKPAGVLRLSPRLPAGCSGGECALYQDYTTYAASGEALGAEKETWLYSWYSTAGKLKFPRTLGADETNTWFGPETSTGRGDPPAPDARDGVARLYLVVRDRRGGVDFARAQLLVTP